MATDNEQAICTTFHAVYAFDVLSAHFEKRQPISPPFDNADDSYALFVTWNTVSRHGEKSLRGCIGNFSPMPLSEGLKDYALVSALQDHRFSPIKQSELPSLSCGISLLTPFTPISSPLDWTPGQHGIHITFPNPSQPSRTLSATYLPEVAEEQGWDQEEAVLSAIKKAGYRGRVVVGDEIWKSLKVKVYGSEKAEVDWEGYQEWMKVNGRA